MRHKQAELRYRIIDESLRNNQVNCTMELLIRRCSYHLSELKGEASSISERTIYSDLKALREGIKGAPAPIKCCKGTYYYDDEDFELSPSTEKIIDLIFESLKDIERLNLEMHQTREYLMLLEKMSRLSDYIIPDDIDKEISKAIGGSNSKINKMSELPPDYINNLEAIHKSIKSRSSWFKKLDRLQKLITKDFKSKGFEKKN